MTALFLYIHNVLLYLGNRRLLVLQLFIPSAIYFTQLLYQVGLLIRGEEMVETLIHPTVVGVEVDASS